MNKRDIYEIFKALTLFFILTVVSIVMVFAKFEEGVVDFWESKEELKSVVNEINFDIEKEKTTGEVDEFRQNIPFYKDV